MVSSQLIPCYSVKKFLPNSEFIRRAEIIFWLGFLKILMVSCTYFPNGGGIGSLSRFTEKAGGLQNSMYLQALTPGKSVQGAISIVFTLPVLYFCVGFIGFFIGVVIHLKKETDGWANGLLGAFIGLISFSLMYGAGSLYGRYDLFLPSLTGGVSLLYGPVLFAYRKRVLLNRAFTWADGFHGLPAIVYFLLLFLSNGRLRGDWELVAGLFLPCASLLVYGYLCWKIKGNSHIYKGFSFTVSWHKGLLILYGVYSVLFMTEGIVVYNGSSSFIVDTARLIVLAAIILYIGYVAYTAPQALHSYINISYTNGSPVKYKKSALTDSYSKELKEALLKLLNEEKIFKDSAISLDSLSEKLQTTRHNASQVINEHFNMGFFELINTYRVQEAIEILKNDAKKKLTIIDIAYEVGFNNKVSFNKSFKKETSLTPTQYVERVIKKGKMSSKSYSEE